MVVRKMEFIEIGKIIKTHALKGELSVASNSDFIEERFKVGATLYVKQNGIMKELEITSVRFHQNNILITVNNWNDINLVTHLVGLTLYVNRDQLPELAENEYYYSDLIGLEVFATTNEYIGKITDVLEYPHGSILEIYNEDKKILIPFVDAFVKDIKDGKVMVELIEGLV
jgi:16S rRNA processing protein RimM